MNEHPVTKKNNDLKGYIQVFIGGALWGTIGPFIKVMESLGSNSAMTSFLRMAFSALILIVITIALEGTAGFKVDKKTLLACALLGIVSHGIYNIFYSAAVTQIGVTISAVLLDIAPVFTALFSIILFKEKMSGTKVIALLVNIAGCVLAVTGGKFDLAGLSVVGILCGIGAGFTYALTAIFGRLAGEKTSAFVLSTYSYIFSAAFLAVFTHPWTSVPVTGHLAAADFFYALIPTAIAYIFYYLGVQKITETSKVPVIASVETVVAALFGILLYKEVLGAGNFIGIVLVMLSILMMNSRSPEKAGQNNIR